LARGSPYGSSALLALSLCLVLVFVRLRASRTVARMLTGPGLTGAARAAAEGAAEGERHVAPPRGVRCPSGHKAARHRFGAQTDTRVVRSGTSTALTRNAVANYIAKYATKDPDVPGMPDYRLRSASEIRELRSAARPTPAA
jgi:hypothetical protein